jgi:putative ATP-dependent endonuclease of OLD family
MYLHALQVENFRGVRRARLTFDETTVLIGENDCGKTSLLEALALVLGTPGGEAPRFQAEHFHRRPEGTPDGAIRVHLDFRERERGEWNRLADSGLESLIGIARRPRRMEVRFEGEENGDGSAEVHWTIDVTGQGRRRSRDDAGHLAAVRRMNPIMWLKGGVLAGTELAAPDAEAPKARILEEIETNYRAVIAGRDIDRQLEAGCRTARQILSRTQIAAPAGNGLSRSIVAGIVGTRGVEMRKTRSRPSHGSAAQKLGTLILAAALLRSMPSGGVGGGDPILIVEDPEAHLHIMTLATVWGLLEEIPAQKVVTTQSGTLLLAAPLHNVRRLTRRNGVVRQWKVPENLLSRDDLRKVSYHLRMKRSMASFARCWFLVEGETEFWMLPELARIGGYDFILEGIACIEFAQCGLPPLIKVANALGIEWHVLTDGDDAGKSYANIALGFAKKGEAAKRVTKLEHDDIERCFWEHGFADVFQRLAGKRSAAARRMSPSRVIDQAIRRRSKPAVAFDLILAAAEEGTPDVPMPLRWAIEMCVKLARKAG